MGIASNNPANVSAGVCTSTTRPNNPYEGQMVYVTDLDELQVWNGLVWFTLYVDITPIESALEAAQDDIDAIDATLVTYGSNIASNASAIASIQSDLIIFDSQIDANASAIANIPLIPAGGMTGQVLAKTASGNYAMTWQTAPGALPLALVDAKGDLLVGSANDAVVRVPVGADGAYLIADSTSPSGVSWSIVTTVTTQQVNSKAVAMALVFG